MEYLCNSLKESLIITFEIEKKYLGTFRVYCVVFNFIFVYLFFNTRNILYWGIAG